ncbi:histidine kinase [Massilia niastensis]|uniref:histidine kinase n=1 Tax=Massilia niastensis TaxID=544911 RepID=UPI00036C404F|nr:histidine kinase [Massilia niastensis]
MDDLAGAFAACRDAVFAHWRKHVSVEGPTFDKLGKPRLIEALETLYEDMTRALSSCASASVATSGTDAGSIVGPEDVIMSQYGAHDLVHEMQIFRKAVFSVAEANGLGLTRCGAELIGHCIESATRELMIAYSALNKEASGAFVKTLSDDLRNPLHVAHTSAQLLELKSSDPHVIRLAKRIREKLCQADAMILAAERSLAEG